MASDPATAGSDAAVHGVVLQADDVDWATAFYRAAFGLADVVSVRPAEAPSTGFRGFTLSLVVSQPSTVRDLVAAAVDAGVTTLKPPAKSFWGYGGVVQAPDGAIWKVASSAKKDTATGGGRIEQIALLLGASDVLASKRFYVDQGFAVAKSFGRKYVEFSSSSSPITLGLYGRRALAKDAGVAADGDGAHRIVIRGASGTFTDPDGFEWGESGA